MPEGPFGFPRVTSLGPFSEMDAEQEFNRDNDYNVKPPVQFLDREISIIHDDYSGLGGVDVEASLIVREQIDEPGERIVDKIEHEMEVITREENIGHITYFYSGDVGRVITVNVDKDFRRMGIGTKLKNKELDHMQDEGVEVVYTDIISDGGYRLAKRTEFKPIDQADHIDFMESSLTFNHTSKRGIMFKYL